MGAEAGESVFVSFNPNPFRSRVGDCAIRAVSKATGQTWESVFVALCLDGFCAGDMPNANHVWGAYLRRKGFKRHSIPETCPDCYTVSDFCRDFPRGVYVLATNGHVLAVVNGDWYDTWDSGGETPLYYWEG